MSETPQSTAQNLSAAAYSRTLGLLSAAQAVAGSQQALIMSVAALVGIQLSPDPSLATLPTTSMIIGLALFSGPATFIIYKLERQRAFMFGSGLSMVGGLLAAMGIVMGSFILFCSAMVLCGAGAAFGQQYRFAAADSVPAPLKGKAISWVLAGGVISGFVGPALSRYGQSIIPGADYAASFLMLSGLAVVAIGILSMVNLAPVAPKTAESSARPFSQIVRSAKVFVPIISGMASYGLMTFVMVATPLAMVIVCGHSKASATTAIQWHIVSMYAPSFFTGPIIARIGARAVTSIGLALILACVLILLNGTSIVHFNFALILLGVGWNFGFIGSTALLSQGYKPEDAGKTQAVNEQLVFGTMAIASMSSGFLLENIGWQSINVLVIPIATAAIALLGWHEWHSKKSVSA